VIQLPTKQQAKRQAGLVVALLAWFSFVLGAATSAALQDIEHQVKAAVVYNFTKFVVWPDEVFPSDGAPLTMCVTRSSSLATILSKVVAGRKVQGRPLEALSFDGSEPPAACNLVFIDASQDAQVAQILDPLSSKAVLTVGESSAFAADGGMIRLVTQAGKIRFDINAASARRAGLRIRSQLLGLARSVEK